MDKFIQVLSMVKPALIAADVMEQVGNACLDALEEVVKRTDNQVDDALVLPAIKGLRHIAGIAAEHKTEEPHLEIVE